MTTSTVSAGGGSAIRIVTLLWVCLSNLVLALIVLSRLLDERTLYRLLETHMPWNYYSLPISIIVVLFAGMALEAANWRAAFFVNAGFFLLMTGWAAVGLAHGWQEPESRTVGFSVGVPASLILTIDVLLYAAKKRLRQSEPPA